MNKIKAFLIILSLFIILIPAFRLGWVYLNSLSYDGYSIEIESDKKIITRYVYDEKSDKKKIENTLENRKQFSSENQLNSFIDNYYTTLNSQYQIDESQDLAESFYDKSLDFENNQELNILSKKEKDTLLRPVLGINDKDIIGDLNNFEVLHNFDDSGYDDIDESIKDTDVDKVAIELDKKGKEEIDVFISGELLLDDLSRDPSSLKVFDSKKFYTSPLPSIVSTNTLFILNQLKLNIAKKNYYSFEIIKYNLISKEIVNINDLSIYVIRNKYVFPNIGGKNDYFFKYKNNIIYGTAALGYNPPPGKYTVIVKSKSNPEWKGVSASFNLLKRRVPEIPKGFSVVNMEYTIFLKNIKVQGIDGKLGNYKNLAKWVKFMGADAFWMLVAQTTGWHKTITPAEPWVKGGLKNLHLLAPVMRKNGIKVGAYIMSYFTPANGKKKAGYEASLGYNSKTDKIEDSLHISLNNEKRIQDIIALAKTFNANPNVDFIGMDFIRTGRADGYEMGPLVVEDMNIKTPSAYNSYSYLEKIKWFAKKVENLNNKVIVRKWRYWRATKTATIINRLITEGNITKPVWCFTLGWEHGKQHGQDPYMFFDAGATIDAVMLYEANEKQFNNMLIQWPNYMRNNLNNMLIGNSSDVRLLDSSKRNTPAEFTYRTKKGYSDVYRKGLAKGIFMHDISRALWSSKRGIDIKDWAIVYGHSISEFKREYGLMPYEVNMKFNKDKLQGTITIINHSDQEVKNLSIKYIENYHWEKIEDNIPINLKLKPKSKNLYTFIAEPRKNKIKKELILGYKLTHPRFPQYISYTQRSRIDYDQYAYEK